MSQRRRRRYHFLAPKTLGDTIEFVEGTPQSQGPEPWSEKTNQGCNGCFMAFLVIFIGLYICGFFLGPINPGVRKARESAAVQTAHALGISLYSYANDHKGLYPDGTSSTAVFQQLLDGGYITDPSIFYVAMDGKTALTDMHQKLKPENVCWDVTGGVSGTDEGKLPLVFLTGFRFTYAPGGGFTPLTPFPPYEYLTRDSGEVAFFLNNSAAWMLEQSQSSGSPYSLEHTLPAAFDAHGKRYRQLTPDGPLR